MQTRLRKATIKTLLVLLASVLSLRVSADEGDDWATVVDRTSHRASSFDKTGGNADYVANFEPGKSIVMLDTDGPGKITHLWFTVSGFSNHPFMLRDLALRITWENAKVPSVEVPLGDFFGLGHGKTYNVHCKPINVGENTRALNCYWPMPFYKHARLELVNRGERSFHKVYFNVDYELGPIPPRQGLFHAEFRRVKELPPQQLAGNIQGRDNYVILDAQGEGQYAGCFLFVDSAPGGWWGEGDEMMFFDGEKTPSITGTGTEDYFCNAWGFHAISNYPYYGVPFMEVQPDGWTQTAVYRLHLPDPVRFKKSLRVTIEHGWPGKAANDYSSVAFWYQLEPNAQRQPLPEGLDILPKTHLAEKSATTPKSFRISATELEPVLLRQGIAARALAAPKRDSYKGGFLQIDSPGKAVEIPLAVHAPGKYRVAATLRDIGQTAPVSIGFKGGQPQTLEKIEKKQTIVELGEIEVGADSTVTIAVESSAAFAIDSFQVEVQK
jgi:hypothetical protein